MSDPPVLALLQRSMRRTRRLFLAIAIVCIALGLAIALLANTDDLSARGGDRALAIGVTVLGIALALGARLFIDPRKRAAARLIIEASRDVCWIYVHHITVNGFTTNYLQIHTVHGKRRALRVATVVLDPVLAEIARTMPHATLGLSDEAKAAFKRDPRLLLRPVPTGSHVGSRG